MSGTGLTEEQQALLDMVADYAAKEVAPRAAEDEEAGRFPRDLLDGLGRLDCMGLPFPEELGGGGQPYGVYLRVVEQLSRAFLTVGLGLSVHNLATWAVATYGAADLRSEVAPRLTAGEWLGAYSLSEPGSGSDAAGLVTRAEKDDGHYVVTGTKSWVTHAGHADCYVLLCRTGEHKTRGISALLVPGDTQGLTFAPPERKMGMRSSPTGGLVFDGARVPARNLLGEEGQGFKIALSALDGGRLGIAACAVGVAQAATDHAIRDAGERQQFGRPIGTFQGVQFMLADMATGVDAARALYLHGAALRDGGEPYSKAASMAKLFATDTAMRVTTDAVQVFGGYGYTREYPVERLMREAKALQIVEGTNQVQRMVIARHLLGR
jgi:alkylation response protein AidB-like acyl-CoA dehydrogenase